MTTPNLYPITKTWLTTNCAITDNDKDAANTIIHIIYMTAGNHWKLTTELIENYNSTVNFQHSSFLSTFILV